MGTNSGSVGGGAEGQAHGPHRQGQGQEGRHDEIGQMENFHEDEQADKRGDHQTGIDPAGAFQAQAGHQMMLGRGQVRLHIRKFVDPDDGGDEKGQGQADGGAQRG